MYEDFSMEGITEIEAVGKRILVELVEIEEKKGILIIPEDDKQHQIGKVVSAGQDVFEIEIDQYVYTRKYAGLLLNFKGKDYVSLSFDEILAVSDEIG